MKFQRIITFCFVLFVASVQAQEVPVKTIEDATETSIKFDNTEFDFGTMESGEVAEHSYIFTNTGDAPLLITNARGSCGCTVPKWPKEPIMPGKTGEIKVRFNSKNKKGKQSKRVTLTTNAGMAYLIIKGELTSPKKEEEVAPTVFNDVEKKEDESILATKDCFAIYPNPTADVLKLDLKEQAGKKVTVSIYDFSGKIMDKKTFNETSRATADFDVRDYPQGQYIASIEVEGQKPVAKCFVVGK